jgi:hypothetical protein
MALILTVAAVPIPLIGSELLLNPIRIPFRVLSIVMIGLPVMLAPCRRGSPPRRAVPATFATKTRLERRFLAGESRVQAGT